MANDLPNFDPSDVDGAMQLAYASLALTNAVAQALTSNRNGLRMGRDEALELAVRRREVLSLLGVEDAETT